MNVIWLVIVVITILYCLCSGQVDVINEVFVTTGKETFDFVIPMLCITVFWNGMLYVAKEAGILHFLERLLHPLLKRLFPDIKHDEETLGYVAANVVVNMVGLGSAATPMGLKAMEGMQRHNPHKDTATRSMITFLVLNTAGVTLLSTSLIAIRATYHAQDITGFMPYAVISTCFASCIGVCIDRWWNYRD